MQTRVLSATVGHPAKHGQQPGSGACVPAIPLASLAQRRDGAPAAAPPGAVTTHELQALLEELRAQQVQALELATARVDLKLKKVVEMIRTLSESSEKRLDSVEQRLEVGLGDLELRFESDRTERQMAIVEVRKDLDGQWAQLANLSTSQAGLLRADLEKRGAGGSVLGIVGSPASTLGQSDKAATLHQDVEALQDEQRLSRCEINTLRAEQSRILDELRSGGSTALRQQLQKVAGDMEGLRTQAVNAIEALRHQHGGIMEALRSQQQKVASEVELLRAQCQGMAATRAAEPVALGSFAPDAAAGMESLRQHFEALRSQCDKHQSDVLALQAQCSQTASSQRQVMGEFDAVKSQFVESIKALQGQHMKQSSQIEMLMSQQGSEIGALRSESTDALSKIRNQSITALEGLQENQARAVEHQRDVQTLRTEAERIGEDVVALKSQSTGLETFQRQQAQSLELFRTECKRETAALQGEAERLGRDLAALKGQQSSALELLRREQGSAFNELQRQCRSDLEGLRGELSAACKSAVDALREELGEECLSKVESLRSELKHNIAGDLQALQTAGADHGEFGREQGKQALLIEALRCQHSRAAEVQSQLMSDVGAIKGQLVDNLRTLQKQHGRNSAEIEALQDQHRSTIEMLQLQQEKYEGDLESLRGTVGGNGDLEMLLTQHSSELEELRLQQGKVGSDIQALIDQQRDLIGVMQSQHARDIEALRQEEDRRAREIEALLERQTREAQRGEQQQSGFFVAALQRAGLQC